MAKYTRTGEHTYTDEDGFAYDLSDLGRLGESAGAKLHLSISKGGESMEIVTNGNGEGQFMAVDTPSGTDYRQTAGTLQYQLPRREWALCDQLRRMWDEWDEATKPAEWDEFDDMLFGTEDAR
ncbi:MAG: hypothetical protein PUF11_09560 [Parafannyhessea umbonata]|uniref:hypothetical protein n=1 Tax=Parafannyhessea umbonata TaxID=604330 RepID=UPI0026ED41D7|nr:hypothetical protein [Parafannyhessea umbonata]MDD6567012.1 hypothetical protein [Parafannyhessea umbonata]